MKIEKSIDEQCALMPLVRDDWLKITRDTTPVDRAQVREIVSRLYALTNRPSPKNFVFLDSPLQISNTISVLRLEGEKVQHQVTDPNSGEVRHQVDRQFRAKIDGQFSAQLKRALRRPTVDIAHEKSRLNLAVAELVQELQFSDHIRAEVLATVRKQLFKYVAEQIHGEADVQNQIKTVSLILGQFLLQVRDQIQHPLGEQVGRLRAWPFRDDFGQFDVSLAWYDFLGRLGIDISNLTPSIDLAKSCGWAVLFWDWAFISARPEFIRLDDQGRLHSETGPAIRYPDGFSVYALHGVRVPERVVLSMEMITALEIETEDNSEVRRVMIERYGIERFLMDSRAEEIHRDDFGILYRKDTPVDEPLVMVKVVNATPEPDGSFKDYFLRVPPEMERARQAVAWTFGKEENDYAPEWQT